jgi:hypothetical protein
MRAKRGARDSEASEVGTFMSGLRHPRKNEIEAVRSSILASAPGITERLKWNAPSFGSGGDDRVTFRLQPGNRVQLIFHRGAKVRADADRFTFKDPTGLLEWVTADRGVVTFDDDRDVKAKTAALKKLVKAWMHATKA